VNESLSLGHIITSIALCMTNLGDRLPDVETSRLVTSKINMANPVYHPPHPNQHGHFWRISKIFSSMDKYWSFTDPFCTMSWMKSCKKLLKLYHFTNCNIGCDILRLCCIECYRSLLPTYPKNRNRFQAEATT
jgi:hypothetical protein